jgi:hypothetical protein
MDTSRSNWLRSVGVTIAVAIALSLFAGSASAQCDLRTVSPSIDNDRDDCKIQKIRDDITADQAQLVVANNQFNSNNCSTPTKATRTKCQELANDIKQLQQAITIDQKQLNQDLRQEAAEDAVIRADQAKLVVANNQFSANNCSTPTNAKKAKCVEIADDIKNLQQDIKQEQNE